MANVEGYFVASEAIANRIHAVMGRARTFLFDIQKPAKVAAARWRIAFPSTTKEPTKSSSCPEGAA